MLPFRDRRDAGEQLAARLEETAFGNPVLVLGLPRGGLPVAAPVADRLGAPLDVLVVRKLGVPGHPELAMGAICNNVRVLDDELIHRLGITPDEVERVTHRERTELQRRISAYRGDDAVHHPIEGASVIVVDDGVATGSTMSAACRALHTQSPEDLTVAVPVAAPEAVEALRRLADRVVFLRAPRRFGAVGSHYLDFTQTSDPEVRELLSRAQ